MLVFTLLLLLVVSAPARAEVVTLAALEQLALESRPELLAEEAEVKRTVAMIDQAESSRMPQLALGADTTLSPGGQLIEFRDEERGEDFLIQGTRTLGEPLAYVPLPRYFAGLTLQAPIYDFGRVDAAVSAAKAAQRVARADIEVTRRQIVQSVRAAYVQWLSRSELRAISERAITDARSRRERVEASIEEGARPKSDLALARSAEALARLESQRAQAALEDARMSLEAAVGRALPEAAEPDVSLLRIESGKGPAEDPELDAVSRRIEAVDAQEKASARASAPLISGVAEAGIRGQVVDLFPAYRVGIGLSVPLWDGGRSRANASAAAAEAEGLRARADALRKRRQREIERSASDRRHAEETLAVAEELLAISEQRLREAEEGYELGARTIEAISDARAQLNRALSEIVIARAARAEAILRWAAP